jgi:TonB family protein
MMSDLVSSAIGARSRANDSFGKPLVVSVLAHVALIGMLVVMPRILGLETKTADTLMTISLGGVAGPVSGGMTPISGRPIQRVEPMPELPRPQAVRPPAARTPEMVEPTKTTRQTRPPVTRAPTDASGRTPTTGPVETRGASKADVKGAATNETGLSTGGGGDNSQVMLGNFCEPQYLGEMIALIHRNWNARQTVAGSPIIRYVIQRDGTLTDVSIKQSSGYQILDIHAHRAVVATRAIPPLPSCYPYPTFIVNLTFEYTR